MCAPDAAGKIENIYGENIRFMLIIIGLGVIHTDFSKNFIAAEITAFKDFKEYQNYHLSINKYYFWRLKFSLMLSSSLNSWLLMAPNMINKPNGN